MSSTTKYADAISQAIQTIADSSARNKEATLVVEAEVVEIIDAGIGIYNVKYLGNVFKASSSNVDTTYKIGDIVYILIPNGNFDNNKIIISLVNVIKASGSTKGGSDYVTISDNLIEDIDIKLSSKYNQSLTFSENISEALFNATLQDSRVFNLTCTIRTDIEPSRRTRGEYGFTLKIPITKMINGKQEKGTYEQTISSNNLIGSPYELFTPALQNFYFTFPEDCSYDTNENRKIKIEAFSRDFVDAVNGKPTEEDYDIFIDDIKLLSVKGFEKVEDTIGYASVITASGGSSFTASSATTKTLTVTPYYNNRETSLDGFSCYWFVQDVSINSASEKYSNLGGIGWRLLNEVSRKNISKDGQVNYEYVLNKYTYDVKQSDIRTDMIYKCILVKDTTKIVSDITIRNLASPAKIELTSLNGTVVAKNVGKVKLQVAYSDEVPSGTIIGCSWARYDKNNNYIDNNFGTVGRFNKKKNNVYYTDISFSTSIIEDSNTFACTVYLDIPTGKNKYERKIVGTDKILISTNSFAGGKLTLINGDKLYKYDSDGDSPLTAEYDGPLSSAIKIIDPIEAVLYKEDGTEFTEDEYNVTTFKWYIPKKSMVQVTGATSDEDYYIKTGKKLEYTIAGIYNKTYNNNTIKVEATAPSTLLKKPLSTVANIRFLKDGESGTNGTKYSAVVCYQDSSRKFYGYGENGCKLQMIYVNQPGAGKKRWRFCNTAKATIGTSKPTFKVQLYADGVPKTPSDSAIAWSVFDASSYNKEGTIIKNPINNITGGVLTPTTEVWNNSAEIYTAIIEAKVKVGDSSSTGSQEYIYAYYPIECTRFETEDALYFNNKLMTFLPTVTGGFHKVTYASDGTNPQYDNSNPFYIKDVLNNIDELVSYDYTWSGADNLKVPKKESGGPPNNKIFPVSKYDNGLANNYVRATIPLTLGVEDRDVVESKISFFETLKDYAKKERNYYNQMFLEVDKIENFDYNNYIEKLKETEDFFNFKVQLIQAVTNMQLQGKRLFKTYTIYNVDTTKVSLINSRLETLLEKVVNLGLNNKIINQIIESGNPSDLVLLPFEIKENTPYYYKEINALINVYAFYLNMYANYYNKMKNNEVTDSKLVAFIKELNDIPNNYKSLAEQSLVDNPTDEMTEDHQRYIDLRNYLLSKVALSTKDIKTSNYSGLKDEVLDVMFEAISWYKKETLEAYYSDLYNEKNNDYNTYEKNLNVYNRIKDFNDKERVIYHIQPILMIYNRYEKSFLNGWDGNKLETAEGYLIAPQVGAGKKDSKNTFTGIVIGTEKTKNNTTKTGLFGYHQGAQSIFLDAAKGSATFGESTKSQIIIDPSNNKAIIKSGNYIENKSGMIIDFTEPEIKFGSGNFKVSSAGHLTAKGGGSIAGWTIGNETLTGGGTTLNKNGTITCADLIANSSGSIGGWTISSSGLNKGGLYITSNSITGKIYSGDHNAFDSKEEGFYLSSNGLSIGKNFSVSETGHLIAKDLEVQGGKIGGWTIGKSTISSEGIILDSTGSIRANDWSLKSDGNATFNNITCNNIWSFGKDNNTWSNDGFNFQNGNIGNNTVTTSGLSLKKGMVELGEAVQGGKNGISVKKENGTWKVKIAGDVYANDGYFKGEVYATSGTFKGEIEATSIDFKHIDGEKTYYLNMNQTTNHPNVSGLNIGWGGLVFGTNTFSGYGIRGLSNIGSGGANLFFKASLPEQSGIDFKYDYLYTESKMVFKDSSLLMIGTKSTSGGSVPDKSNNPSTGRPYTRTIDQYVRNYIEDFCYQGKTYPKSGIYISFQPPGTNTWYPCAMHDYNQENE